ncbi:unnamed protein product [Pieris brassicae]|uniref:Uncharacterized protein n=1 Tax=Pieris brassicae TaxID=7116 RepID=A0A9P0XI69_PIEBR|nr:unnamed protein product [Pieris brassicae]
MKSHHTNGSSDGQHRVSWKFGANGTSMLKDSRKPHLTLNPQYQQYINVSAIVKADKCRDVVGRTPFGRLLVLLCAKLIQL